MMRLRNAKKGFLVLALASVVGALVWVCNTLTDKLDETPKQITKNGSRRDLNQVIPAGLEGATLCSRILMGNALGLNLTDIMMLVPRNARAYRQVTWDCSTYREHFGFLDLSAVSSLELSFPLAFSVLVYKHAEQVERLMRAIYRPHNVYCIHVDFKASNSFRKKMALISRCLPNVFLSAVSVNVKWGTMSTLDAELQCLHQLWAQQVSWKYYINLTGQEWPLKTNRELVQILSAFRGANDISGDCTQDSDRWENLPPAPYHIKIYKGSVHVAATRAYVDYILHSNVSRQFLGWLQRERVVIPDELFFNTLNNNAHLGVPGSAKECNNYRPKDSFTRYKVWKESSNAQNGTIVGLSPPPTCAGRFLRRVCHFGTGDLPRLVRSAKLFANKFSYNYQPLAYDCLEMWLLDKIRKEGETDKGEVTLRFTGTVKKKKKKRKRHHGGRKMNITVYTEACFVKNRYLGPVKVW